MRAYAVDQISKEPLALLFDQSLPKPEASDVIVCMTINFDLWCCRPLRIGTRVEGR